jgi:replicative DNA helicase
MADRIERQLPHDINAEAAVLSAMIIDNAVVAKALEKLEPDHFYRKTHETIFRTIAELFNSNIEIDLITLIDRLKTNKQLENVGGESFLNELSDVVMSGANSDYHIQIVLERALLRQLITTSNKIIETCYNSDDLVENIVDNAEQSIFKIAERPNRKTFRSIGQIIPQTLEDIEKTAATKNVVHGVSTGFVTLDRLVGGFRPGQFIVLAARPAMGKTSLALNIAATLANNNDKKIAIFTMEMEAEELLMRMLSSLAEVEMDIMIKGYGMSDKMLLRLAGAADELSKRSIFIDDSGTNTILDIRAKTRRLQAEIKNLDLIIIDYLQLMSAKKGKENRQQEISEISRNLKELAKELKVPIMALSQLNRGLESREDKRPKLADLRESGAIEQDADLVLFIYRDEVYYEDKSEKPNIAEIIIGKNRHGPIGSKELYFDKKLTRFRDVSQYDTKYSKSGR